MVLLAIAPLAALAVGGRRRLAGWINFLFCLAAGTLFAGASVMAIRHGATESSWVAFGPGGAQFLLDGFSGVFLALISLIAVAAAFYSIRYLDHYARYSARSYYVSYPIFFLGMVGIVTVDDLSAGFSVAWQLMTLASFLLIRFDREDPRNVRVAWRYLVLMELAWLFILGGASLIPGAAAGDSLHELTSKLASSDATLHSAVYALLLLGFALKAGVFPLGQLWLPDAHSVAPSPVSAVLSGVMIKTGIFGIARTLFWMVPASAEVYDGRVIGLVVAALGTVTLFIGTSQALKQNDAKRLHAYSSIGQMGYIVLSLGSAFYLQYSDNPQLRVLAAVGLVGALFHVVNHGVFKALLFLCTGSVQYVTGSKDLNRLGGLIHLMPLTTVLAAIAAAAVAGIPAFSGFISKWAIVSAGLLAGKDTVVLALFAVVALMTGAMTLAAYVKFFGLAFAASGDEAGRSAAPHSVPREVPLVMLVPKGILAAICLFQGLFPAVLIQGLLLALRGTRSSFPAELPPLAMPVALVLIFAAAFVFARWLRAAGGARERKAPVWLCGYQQFNGSHRYGSDAMYAAFKNFTRWTGGNVK